MARGSYEDRQQANDRSKLDAEHHGEPWSADEDDLIRETMDEPIADVAYVLGRSIFAVDMRRSQVRNNTAQARETWSRLRPKQDPIAAYGERCTRCGLVHRGEC